MLSYAVILIIIYIIINYYSLYVNRYYIYIKNIDQVCCAFKLIVR